MTREELFAAQFNFCAVLWVTDSLYKDGLITKTEYQQIKKMFVKHYDPPVKLDGVEPVKK